jgi:multidrug efflux pump subunit AcrA (membrane-fusion protein)
MKIIITKKIAIITGAVLLIGLTAFLFLRKGDTAQYTTAKVERGDLIQTISETGTVKAAKEINLNFLTAGRISVISAKIGNKVEQGEVLAKLDATSLFIKEKEAQANLDVARANLAKLFSGASREEIAVSQANASQAETAYLSSVVELDRIKKTVTENIRQAEKTLNDLKSNAPSDITPSEKAVDIAQTNLNNAKNTYGQAVANKESIMLSTTESELTDANSALDSINTLLNDTDAKDVLSVKNTAYLSSAKFAHGEAALLIITAKTSLVFAKTSKTEENINTAANDAASALNKTFEALSYIFSALENSITSSSFTQTDLDAYKTTIGTKQTTISSSISAVDTAKQDLDDARLSYKTNVASSEQSLFQAETNLDKAILDAENAYATSKVSGDQQISAAQTRVDNAFKAWQTAKSQLNEIKAGARREDIALTQAQVNQAQAALDSVRKQIDDNLIKSPIKGTVTKVNYEVGEEPVAGKPVISLLGENNFEIEVDISESDIAKVKVGDLAAITLDAFGEQINFPAKVYFIEPAETVIQEVIYYKVKVEFDRESEEYKTNGLNIKSGMTANIIITTAKKENILIMPNRGIIEKSDGGKFARILIKNKITEAPVIIGLRGDGGMVEALSGVKEGDEVVTFIKAAN